MSIWKRRKMPSRPMTDGFMAKKDDQNPQIISDKPTIPTTGSESEDIPTKALRETILRPSHGDVPPDLVQSLHTAALTVKPSTKEAGALGDTNVLLQPLGFKCHRLLGTGGMGSVFLATDLKLQRMVAIKVLLPKFSGNEEFAQLFLKEAEIIAKFTHPNIVQIYSIHVVHNIYFIVMEYVEGTTLRDKIKKEGRISEEATLRIIDQVSQALSETHKRGIVHRDIKPQNILLTRDAIPKVADFGLAVNIRETQLEGIATAGTPTYMSPEQARGDVPTPASDIYSLGVVMYFMLSGKIPYRANSVNEVLKEISAGNKIDIKEAAPGLSPGLIRLVRKSMEPHAAQRYQSMLDFNTAVRNAWLAYQRPGLKPMLPRVKRTAWAYLAPPAALVAGLLLGYMVHNPWKEKTDMAYQQAFTPRVEHLKRSLLRIMESETNQVEKVECAKMITLLDSGLNKKNPEELSKYISQAEFMVDWYELEPVLLKLQASGALTGDLLTEARALWEAAQKKNPETFYLHRSQFFKILWKTNQTQP